MTKPANPAPPRRALPRALAFGALFAALAFLLTYLTKIPIGIGYLNLGDTAVLLSGLFAPLPLGPLGAALGSAMADLAAGYVVYMPFTFLIKLAEGLLAACLFRALGRRFLGVVLGAAAGGLLMAVGYLLSEAFLIRYLEPAGGYGWLAALGAFPWNLLQGAAGALVAVLAYAPLSRIDRTGREA